MVGSDLCPPVDVFTCKMFLLAAGSSPSSTAGQMFFTPYSVFLLLQAERWSPEPKVLFISHGSDPLAELLSLTDILTRFQVSVFKACG